MTKYIGKLHMKLQFIYMFYTFACDEQDYFAVMLLHIHPFHFYSSRDTFIEREPGESANDRNDRAIRVAVKWYSQHLKTSTSDADGLKVVLLTNDQGNKQKAEESGLLVYKCKWSFPRKKISSGTVENLLQISLKSFAYQEHSSQKHCCK